MQSNSDAKIVQDSPRFHSETVVDSKQKEENFPIPSPSSSCKNGFNGIPKSLEERVEYAKQLTESRRCQKEEEERDKSNKDEIKRRDLGKMMQDFKVCILFLIMIIYYYYY